MPTVTIELPSQEAQTAGNLRRWAELLEDPMTLYFDAGAEEVWLCDLAGNISFHEPAGPPPLTRSRICPEFPTRIILR